MLMMLALRFKKSVQSLGRMAAAAAGSEEGKLDKELESRTS